MLDKFITLIFDCVRAIGMTDGVPDIAWVDTIDVCQLKCPTCIRGVRGLPNSSRKMSLDTFAAIVARLRDQGFVKIGLFNWTEPFLNQKIHEYVAVAKSSGFWITLSSTLSLRHIDNLEETLVAGVDLLTVSLSGIDQETYQINHVGGELNYVMNNLNLVREIRLRNPMSLRVDLRLLKFDYNAGHEQPLREYSERMGFNLEVINGVGNPKSNWLTQMDDAHFVREAAAAADKPSPEDEGKACELMFRQMTIDCVGDVYICCAMPNYPSLRIGKFLEMTANEILAAKYVHPFCRACTMPRRDRTEAEQARLQDAMKTVMIENLAGPKAKAPLVA